MWILDRGASNHMCCNQSLMSNLHIISSPIHIALPNSQTIMVHRVGYVMISPTITLTDVLLIPSFQCNLLSISKLTYQSNITVSFTSSHCFFQVRDQLQPLATSVKYGGLYCFLMLMFLQMLLLVLFYVILLRYFKDLEPSTRPCLKHCVEPYFLYSYN